jgi:hypothetical protein
MNFICIAVTAPLNFLLRIWSTGASYTTVGRYIPVAIAKSIVPAILIGYVFPTMSIFVSAIPPTIKQDLILAWQFAALLVSALVLAFSKASGPAELDPVFDVYSLRDVPHLVRGYQLMFTFSLAYHGLFVAAAVLSLGHPVLSIARLCLPYYGGSEADPLFSLLKLDLAFAALACLLYGIYSVYELRYKGLITPLYAFQVSAMFLGAQVVVGPGAALVGLWWWRELQLAGTRSDEQAPVVKS